MKYACSAIFKMFPRLAFRKTPQGKYTPRLTTAVVHTLHVVLLITRDLPPTWGHGSYLLVKGLIYFDKHILQISCKSDTPYSSDIFWLCVELRHIHSLKCRRVWHYQVVFKLIAECINFLSRLLIKNQISRGRNTCRICDIINSLESSLIEYSAGHWESWAPVNLMCLVLEPALWYCRPAFVLRPLIHCLGLALICLVWDIVMLRWFQN